MSLYEHIQQNKDLFFIDAQTGHAVPVRAFHQSLPIDNRQGLVFIYSDNGIGPIVVPLIVPIVFVFGLSIFTTNCMSAGTILCTNQDILQPDFWTDFSKYNCSTIRGVPYVYEMLQRIGFFKKDHPGLRYMTQTGGIL